MLYIQVHIWNSHARCSFLIGTKRVYAKFVWKGSLNPFLNGQSKSDMSVILFLAGLCWKPRLLGILIAWVTKHRKVNIQDETSEKQYIFSDNQSSSESRSILGVKAKIKAYQIVSNLWRIVRRINWAFWTHTLCAWISSKCGVHGVRVNLLFPTINGLGRCYLNSSWLQIREFL